MPSVSLMPMAQLVRIVSGAAANRRCLTRMWKLTPSDGLCLARIQAAEAAEEAAAGDRRRLDEAAVAARVAADRECDARQHAEQHARGMQQVSSSARGWLQPQWCCAASHGQRRAFTTHSHFSKRLHSSTIQLLMGLEKYSLLKSVACADEAPMLRLQKQRCNLSSDQTVVPLGLCTGAGCCGACDARPEGAAAGLRRCP